MTQDTIARLQSKCATQSAEIKRLLAQVAALKHGRAVLLKELREAKT